MNTLNGYAKSTLTNDYLLTAAGGHKSVLDFLSSSGGTINGALTVTGASTFAQAINASILGNSATSSRLLNARTITIGSKSNTFDGSADISFTLALIGVANNVTSHLRVGASGGNSNATSATSDPYLLLVEGSTYDSQVLLKGNGKTTISANNGIVTISSTWRGIQDNLTSTSTTDSLSAAQGKALNDKFANYLYTDLVSASQNNITWAQGIAKDHRRAFYYNTSGTEWSYLFGFSSSSNSNGDVLYGAVLKMGYTDKYLRILRVSAGTWLSADWEKISAGYADSAGSVTNGVYTTGNQTISGNKTFSSSVSIDDLTAGNLVVTGGASFAQTINGNAATASKWANARTITLSNHASGSVSLDGSENVTLSVTVSGGTASGVTVHAPGTADDSLYNIIFHSGTSLYTSPAKVGRLTGRITCGDLSCGALTASSTISLSNNTSLGFKDTTSTYKNCLTLNTSNDFAIGYGTSGAGYNTYLDGKNIYFRTNTNHTIALTLSSGQTATFAGKVELKSDQYTDNGTTCGLDAKNSNIVGINALYFADYCNSATEGINFKRSSGTHVDTLYCQDGKLFFMPDRLLGSSTGEVIQLNATSDNGKPLNQLLPRATPGNIVEQTADNTYTGIVPAYLFSFMQGKPIFNNFPNNVKYYLNLNHTGSHAGNLWYYDHNNNIYGNLSKYARFQGYAYYNECDGQHMLDGFHVAHSTEAGHTYVCIFCARRTDTCSDISDSELRFEWLSNAVGTGSNSYWITDSHLSHKWQWYGYVVNCGYTGTFSTTNHFSVRCDSSTLSDYTWGWYDIYISYALVFDITNFNYLGMSRVILADTATIAEESKEKVTTLTGEGDKSVTSFGTIIGIPGTGQYMNLKVNIAATDSDIGRILSVRKPLNSGYVRIYWINTANTYLYYSGESHSHSSSTYRQVSDGGYLRYMYLGLDSGNQKWIQI